jgi:heme exporter protein A
VENLRFYGLLYDVPALERRIGEVLQLMRLNHCQDAPVRTLSRGMQQRLALARAFLHNPPLLLLDEPFTGLDQHASATLIEFLQTMHDGSRTIVLTTHNLEQGLALGDRVALLVGGRIVYQAEKETLEAGDFREAYLRYAESEL